MEIQIPSPSVFLRKSPVIAATVPTVTKKQPAKPRGNNNNTVKNTLKSGSATTSTVQNAAVIKPKQSKSRNGCMTCKKKRLKCDETKPACVQCQKRSVTCEGYKKDYKWRTFEETTFNSKAARARKADASQPANAPEPEPIPAPAPAHSYQDQPSRSQESSASPQSKHSGWSPGLNDAFASATTAFTGPSPPSQVVAMASPKRHISPSMFNPLSIFDPSLSPSRFELPEPGPPMPDHYSIPMPVRRDHRDSPSSFSSGSPQLLDLLLPGTDLNQPPDMSEPRPPLSPLPYQPGLADPETMMTASVVTDEEFDEEILREPSHQNYPDFSTPAWHFRTNSPSPSDVSSSSSKSSELTILGAPRLDLSSPEMLMLRFDKKTCGILSVKDGPNENPWRTLIWPLARDSPALYHAISSMTAFHGALELPQLRIAGVAHMTKSIKKLAAEIENMRLDQALATSLALALSEGWDEKISTGIQHLRGAKIMVSNAMVKHRMDAQQGKLTMEDVTRIKFLCNTFVYLDVIARLTSLEESQDMDFADILMSVNPPMEGMIEVDPLMGCATTLFPIIGRIANLIQRVRRINSNGLAIVSEAVELKEELLQWQAPNSLMVERTEDPGSDPNHAIHTAEAYRFATLLYLHQAVPEIPPDPSEALAKKVLLLLSGVPLSSPTTIIQIFPLLVASCEMSTQEDRNWVINRWDAMIKRLSIGNVESCWKVVQEVWRRRDAFEAQKAQRLMRRFQTRTMPPGYFIPPKLNKRKVHTTEAMDEEQFFAAFGMQDGAVDEDPRPLKRRLTMDAMTSQAASNVGMMTPNPLNRRATDVSIDGVEPEYTIRGHLHWIGVMVDWDWEVFLG